MYNLLRLLGGDKNTLSPYDKHKLNFIKAILPIVIIIHHLSNRGIPHLGKIGQWGDIVMYIFFAMSGFGLMLSVQKRKDYLIGFLGRSMLKLYIPYTIAFFAFALYRWLNETSILEVYCEKGVCGLVPTSWYIFVLSLFYAFFFFTFRFLKANTITKMLTVMLLVGAYCILAQHFGVSPWRWNRCPAFCIGLLFGYYDEQIRSHLNWLFTLVLIILLLLVPPFRWFVQPLTQGATFFLVVYLVKRVPDNAVIRFMSAVSLDMFIIQSLAIDLVILNIAITNTIVVVPFVLVLDILFGIVMHRTAVQINSAITHYMSA